jgi:hypothetical protein
MRRSATQPGSTTKSGLALLVIESTGGIHDVTNFLAYELYPSFNILFYDADSESPSCSEAGRV